jgi:hypothetical protein
VAGACRKTWRGDSVGAVGRSVIIVSGAIVKVVLIGLFHLLRLVVPPIARGCWTLANYVARNPHARKAVAVGVLCLGTIWLVVKVVAAIAHGVSLR